MSYSTLISAQELAAHLSDPNWLIIDCRHDLADPEAGAKAFAAGHIPGAQFAHLDDDLAGPTVGSDGSFRGRHPLPEQEIFLEKVRDWGISDDTQVVVYDAHGGMFASRLWWMLRWVGHKAVAVLDGGLQGWQGQGSPVDSGTSSRTRSNVGLRPSLVSTVTAKDIMRNIVDQRRTLLDARAPDRFRGENETLDPVGGHIPGAKNRFFKNNLQEDGRFKSRDQLREELEALVNDPAQAIMQCGSGVTACHNLLALEVAGMSGAALYPGSWSEWCADKTRPVA